MTIKLAIEKLEKNPEFLEWKKENKNAFLSYAFTVLEENKQSDWQIGYYDKKNDKMTTFMFKNDDIVICPDEEIFKKENAKIIKLDIKKVNVSLDKALNYADEFQKKKFPKEESLKIIAILQNISGLSNIWNITQITKNFKILNIKINANTGKIIKYNLLSVFDFKRK